VPLRAQGLRNGEINPSAGQAIWYTGHDRVPPGHNGVTVVAGHVAVRDHDDVFAKLHRVRVGDTIRTLNQEGTETAYVVARTFTVSKEALRSDPAVWGTHTGSQRLVLVTCHDALGLRTDGHRVGNLVVIATVDSGR
jgi:LPXTG-site transpeptidase (sortase) family protein